MKAFCSLLFSADLLSLEVQYSIELSILVTVRVFLLRSTSSQSAVLMHLHHSLGDGLGGTGSVVDRGSSSKAKMVCGNPALLVYSTQAFLVSQIIDTAPCDLCSNMNSVRNLADSGISCHQKKLNWYVFNGFLWFWYKVVGNIQSPNWQYVPCVHQIVYIALKGTNYIQPTSD